MVTAGVVRFGTPTALQPDSSDSMRLQSALLVILTGFAALGFSALAAPVDWSKLPPAAKKDQTDRSRDPTGRQRSLNTKRPGRSPRAVVFMELTAPG